MLARFFYHFVLYGVGLCAAILPCNAQYELLGGAVKLDKDRYRLTRKLHDSQAAIWRKKKLDLKEPFDLKFEAFLGCRYADSDGLAFVLQQEGDDAIGGGSYGLGYGGLSPSIAVEIDNYADDFEGAAHTHVAIMKNGDTDHHSRNNLAGPTNANPDKAADLPDCRRYIVQISWRPDEKRLSVRVDDVWRLSYKGDIIKHIFRNNPQVWMGFTAATSTERFNTQGIRILPVVLPQDEPPQRDIVPDDLPNLSLLPPNAEPKPRRPYTEAPPKNAPPPIPNIPEPPLEIPVIKHPSPYGSPKPTVTVDLIPTQDPIPLNDPKLPPELRDINITYTERKIPDELGGRPVFKRNDVSIQSERIEIWVRDNEQEDGDTISLLLNGEWILYRQPLLSLKRTITVNIQRNADNYLILFAHNLGSIPPNTAAIGIIDRGREMRLALSSTMEQCDAIKFRFDK
jgi:hypothetical protein